MNKTMSVAIIVIAIAAAIILYEIYLHISTITTVPTTTTVPESNYSMANVSKVAISSIGYKNNFSAEYFKYATYPVADGTGLYYAANARFIYTKYNGAYVLNTAIVGGGDIRLVEINGIYTSCILSLSNCNIVNFSGVGRTFLNSFNFSYMPYLANNGARDLGNLTSSGTLLSNSSYLGYPCRLSKSHLQDPIYPNITGTAETCTSYQYSIPLIINVTLNDPYYNNTNNEVVMRMHVISVNESINSTYFNNLANGSQLYP